MQWRKPARGATDPSVAAAEVEPLRLREPIEREDGEIAVESFGRFAVDAARIRH